MKKYLSFFVVVLLLLVGCGKSEIDKFLDEYEEFSEQTVEIYKKLLSQELTFISPEYLDYLKQAADFSVRSENIDTELMTESQLKRFNDIALKIAQQTIEVSSEAISTIDKSNTINDAAYEKVKKIVENISDEYISDEYEEEEYTELDYDDY